MIFRIIETDRAWRIGPEDWAYPWYIGLTFWKLWGDQMMELMYAPKPANEEKTDR